MREKCSSRLTLAFTLALLLPIVRPYEDNSMGVLVSLLTQQCPYTSFCNDTASRRMPDSLSGTYGPCCSPCSCAEHCERTGNCCYRGSDTDDSLSCIEASKGKGNVFPSNARYRMVTRCQSGTNASSNCLQSGSTTQDRSVFPVSSLASGYTFVNEFCAHCNDDHDVVPWNRTVYCVVTNKITEDLFLDAENNICNIHYSPPDGLRYRPTPCYRYIIDRCNISRQWKIYDKDTDLGCQQVRAIYEDPTTGNHYSSLFCFLCNRPDTSLPTHYCKLDEELKTTLSVPFTVLLNLDDLIRSRAETDARITHPKICGPATNRDDTNSHVVCLPLYCPEGKKRQGDDCLPIVDKHGNVNQVSLALKLESRQGERISIDLLQSVTDTDSWKATFKRILPVENFYHLAVFYRKEVDLDETVRFIGISLSVKLSVSADDMEAVLNVISQVLNKEWSIPIGNMSVLMILDFFESPLFCFRGKCAYKQLAADLHFKDKDLQTASNLYVYDVLPSPLFDGNQYRGLMISKTMFCELVELASDMYTEENYTVKLNEWDIRVYPNQMVKVKRNNTFVTRICAEQLPISFQRTSNRTGSEVRHESTALGWLTLTCIAVSSLCLLLTIVVHIVNTKLRQTYGGRNILALCILLLLSQLSFTFGTGQTDIGMACAVIGAFVHMFWLASVFWMCACCVFIAVVLLPKTPVESGVKISKTSFALSLVAVFGLAAAFVGINVAVSLTQSNQIGYGKDLCYIDDAMMRLVTFAVPIGLAVVINLGIFLSTVIRLHRDLLTSQSVRQNKDKLLIYIRLSTLTGVTWITGFIYNIEPLGFFQYIFVILNAGQGVFILIAFVLRRRVLRQMRDICNAVQDPQTSQTDQ